ncbi:hypothetical protein [Endozoicomonas sp.]
MTWKLIKQGSMYPADFYQLTVYFRVIALISWLVSNTGRFVRQSFAKSMI